MGKKAMPVEYLIIGAGMAGAVLRRFLNGERTIVLDPEPERYKIGESIIPNHFLHPVLHDLLPAVRALPSFSEKWGSTFITKDEVASFPLEPSASQRAMHVGREELEACTRAAWKTPVVRERVVSIDLPRKLVTTDKSVYRVEKQIIDCSGPAMVVASSLKDVVPIRPVYSTWTYFDVVKVEDDLFWKEMRSSGRKYVRFDPGTGRILPGAEEHGWKPSKTTILTAVEDGVWTWQIPMFRSKVLSFGVVSRHGPVSNDRLYELAEKTASPQYALRRRAPEGKSALHQVHKRDHFARRARVPATLDYILLADACAFADPIYSVGTGLAVNKAIELAEILNDGGWTPEKRDRWCADYEKLLERAVEAFEFWYTGRLVRDEKTAAAVQKNFLLGNAFIPGIAKHYGTALADSEPSCAEDPAAG